MPSHDVTAIAGATGCEPGLATESAGVAVTTGVAETSVTRPSETIQIESATRAMPGECVATMTVHPTVARRSAETMSLSVS